jgi:hypothetical protein
MEKYEDQNVNTINIPKQSTKKETSEDTNKQSNLVTYKLSIQKKEECTSVLSKEFNELIKEIIDTNNKTFLEGNVNIVEYLISKHLMTEGEEYDNLIDISRISLKVKENFGMLNEFGQYLPNIKELNLCGSMLGSVEEIGTSFVNLKVLNISNCSVNELNGILTLF